MKLGTTSVHFFQYLAQFLACSKCSINKHWLGKGIRDPSMCYNIKGYKY